MKAYLFGGAHRNAMKRLLDGHHEASVAHWDWETRKFTHAREARHHMVIQVRRSRVIRLPATDCWLQKLLKTLAIKETT